MTDYCDLCNIYIYNKVNNIEKCEFCNLLEYYYLILFKFLLIIIFISLIFLLRIN